MSAYQNNPYLQGQQPNTKDALLKGLATSTALYLTLWVAPALYGWTLPFAEKMIVDTYGYDFLTIGKFAHGLASAAVSYFTLRLVMWSAITLITMATAKHGVSLFKFLPA